MNSIKRILKPFSSVTLAVVLMLLAMLLVYAGTIAQIDADNWIVQKRFFASWIAWIGLNDLIPHRYGVNYGPAFLPIPGGFAIGVMLLVNLLAAHLTHFKLTWRRLGVILIHFSLIVLLVGEGVRASMTHEAVMTMPRWASANYTDDDRSFELAVVDPSPADHDSVVVIPQSMLRKGAVIADPKLKFQITIDEFYRNSTFVHPGMPGENPHAAMAAGAIAFREAPPRKREGDPPDQPSAKLTISVPGKLPVNLWASVRMGPQPIVADGKTYVLDLRYKRSYRPYTLYLLKLSHDKYVGSDQTRNFASRVRLFDPEHNEDRDTLIWMNHPLRYRGETFYQFQTLQNDSGTVLQVVDNPGWLLPYVACIVGGLGMLFHFGLSLLDFARRRSQAQARALSQAAAHPVGGTGSYALPAQARRQGAAVLFPAAVLAGCVMFVLWLAWPTSPPPGGFHLADFGTLPALFDGRPQPMQTLARNSLRILSSRESFKAEDGRRISSLQWLLDMMTGNSKADSYRVFRIDSPDVIHLLDLNPKDKFFSIKQIMAGREQLERAATSAYKVRPADRDRFQRSVIELDNKLGLYQMLRESHSDKFRVVPPTTSGEEWKSLGDSHAASRSPAADAFEAMVKAYGEDRPVDFNRQLAQYAALLRQDLPSAAPPSPTTHPTTAPAQFDFDTFGRLPVWHDGVETLDQFARKALRSICGAESYEFHGQRMTAVQWLLEVFSERGQDDPVFRITDPELHKQLGLDPKRTMFAPLELAKLPSLQEAFANAMRTPQAQRTAYQQALAGLDQPIRLYDMVARWQTQLKLSPPMAGQADWAPLVRFHPTPAAEAVLSILESYQAGQPSDFNHYVRAYHKLLDGSSALDPTMRKIRIETMLNRFDPFWYGIIGYLIAFVMACCSWLFWGKPLGRAALGLIVFVLAFHTLGLAARMYIQGRPPVTDLYSSAIFIAWGAVVLAVVLEWVFQNGIGSVCAAAIGAVSLIVAHFLAVDQGDTMKPLQAVLDTNIWLATHVICITLGYASTFLAGFLAIVYVIRGVFTRSLSRERGRDLIRMIYGIACFATLFSFVGTILGGIWADQSWGRFWGWDPKENGAALLVLWNAILLHARWRGLVEDRGFAILAIAGNIVTAWSWFGTNMLGVGLHSYGFMDRALIWLMIFNVSQLVLIAIAAMPRHLWASEEWG